MVANLCYSMASWGLALQSVLNNHIVTLPPEALFVLNLNPTNHNKVYR